MPPAKECSCAEARSSRTPNFDPSNLLHAMAMNATDAGHRNARMSTSVGDAVHPDCLPLVNAQGAGKTAHTTRSKSREEADASQRVPLGLRVALDCVHERKQFTSAGT
jgi:hypothetical protein